MRQYTDADYPLVLDAVRRAGLTGGYVNEVAKAFRKEGVEFPTLNPVDGRQPEPYAAVVDKAICKAVDTVRRDKGRLPLFQAGHFVLRSGVTSKWKIECDALCPSDWEGLAAIAAEILPPFGEAVGVPRGGLPFAEALQAHAVPGHRTLLIAEDVVTTGGSIARFVADNPAAPERWDKVIGVAAFARGACPGWVTPLFALADSKKESVVWT